MNLTKKWTTKDLVRFVNVEVLHKNGLCIRFVMLKCTKIGLVRFVMLKCTKMGLVRFVNIKVLY